MTWMLLVSFALGEECPAATTPVELSRAVAAADLAWIEMDLDGFARARDAVGRTLRCLEAPVDPPLAAGVHRVEALAAFAAEDDAAGVAAWRSVVAAEPSWTPPVSLAPAGHPIAALIADARTRGPGPDAPTRADRGRAVWVDGQDGAPRATERPVVLQHATTKGKVLESVWLPPAEPLPDWASVPEPTRRAGRTPLILASGAAAVVAGGLYGAAWAAHAGWEDPNTALADTEAARGLTNGLVVGAGVAGGAAIGLAVVGIAW